MFEEFVEKINGMTLKELLEERKELFGAIDNEKIWAKGSTGQSCVMHKQNIIMLEEKVGATDEEFEEALARTNLTMDDLCFAYYDEIIEYFELTEEQFEQADENQDIRVFRNFDEFALWYFEDDTVIQHADFEIKTDDVGVRYIVGTLGMPENNTFVTSDNRVVYLMDGAR